MTRRESFGRAVLFAAGAAVLWLPWAALAVPLLGGATALALYLAVVAVGYVVFLAAGLRGRGRAIAGASLAAVVALGLSGSVGELSLALAGVVGVLRSGVLREPLTARSLAVEAVLLGAGLWLARQLGTSWLSPAAALWGFFLVQSLYFLRVDLPAATAGASDGERFDDAYRRAVALLERGG